MKEEYIILVSSLNLETVGGKVFKLLEMKSIFEAVRSVRIMDLKVRPK